jgi:hypothetical protein
MKLNEYLYEKIYAESKKMFQDEECEPLSADNIEKWIVDWYSITFKKVGADGSEPDSSRLPPMWLADWRKVWEREQKK